MVFELFNKYKQYVLLSFQSEITLLNSALNNFFYIHIYCESNIYISQIAWNGWQCTVNYFKTLKVNFV